MLIIVAMLGLLSLFSSSAYAETCTNADGSTYTTIILPCSNGNANGTSYVCFDKSQPETDGKCKDQSVPVRQGATCPKGQTGPGVDGLCQDKSTPVVSISDSAIKNNGIWVILVLVINIMSAGIGVAAVGGIIYGSILYSTGGGNAETTKKARTIIFNVLIGLLMYAVMYAFLNYMIPGGMFNAN